MIELICLAADPIVRLNDSAFIVQPQDPWVAFFVQMSGVLVGGLIAIGANYALQVHSFKLQEEANLRIRRRDAYHELLRDLTIIKFSEESKPMSMFMNHLLMAKIYAGPYLKRYIEEWVDKLAKDTTPPTLEFLGIIKDLMVIELSEKEPKAKSWWQFWK